MKNGTAELYRTTQPVENGAPELRCIHQTVRNGTTELYRITQPVKNGMPEVYNSHSGKWYR